MIRLSAAGRLPLTVVRGTLARIVGHRASDDPHLHDGRLADQGPHRDVTQITAREVASRVTYRQNDIQ